jgi:MFS transporter, DHA1 family, multidrug resistance protein
MNEQKAAGSPILPSILILAFMASLGPFGDTEYTPSLPRIAAALDITYGQAQLTMTVYLAGFALSQVFYGPISDRFGRRPVILIAIATFLVGSLVCALSTDLGVMLFGRFVQALGASAGGTLSNAAVRDAFPPETRTRVFLQVNTLFALAPGIGPIAGSLIDHYLGWEANFYLLVILGAALFLTLFFGFAETNRHLNPEATRPRHFLGNYLHLLTQPVYMFYVVVIGLGIGVIYSSLIEAPRLIMVELGYPSKTFTLVAVCIVAGFMLGAAICGWLSRHYSDFNLIAIGLVIMLVGSLSLGWLDYRGLVTLATALAAIAAIYVGLAFVVPVATARAVAPFETIAGSASALLGSLSMALASASTLLISLLPHHAALAMSITFTLLTVLALFLALLARVLLAGRL